MFYTSIRGAIVLVGGGGGFSREANKAGGDLEDGTGTKLCLDVTQLHHILNKRYMTKTFVNR